MASQNAALADAVVAALNAAPAQATFNQTFTSVRRYVPVTDLDALKTLTVTVIPASDESDRTGRTVDEHERKIFVGVEKRVTVPDVAPKVNTAAGVAALAAVNAELDALTWLVEQIDQFFGTATIAETLGFFINSTIRNLGDPMSLLTEKVFRGVIEVTFLCPTTST